MSKSELSITKGTKKKLVVEHNNPQAKIHLDHDAIDLHRIEKSRTRNKNSKVTKGDFYEFVGANFSGMPLLEKDSDNDYTFDGKLFMSGSKTGKIQEDTKIETMNQEITGKIGVRKVIKICEVEDKDKKKFVR